MSESTQGNVSGIFVATVIGAAVGAGVALLFAPASGKETRNWLAHRTGEIKDRTTNALVQGKEAIRRAAKEIGRDGETDAMTMRASGV